MLRATRVISQERPMRAENICITGGLAGRIVLIFASHIPLIGRLRDQRIESILIDLETELSRYKIIEVQK